jgi:AMP-activated protein kinase-like protein
MQNDEIDSSLQPLVDRLRELPESDPRAVKRVLARVRQDDGRPNARRRALRRYFSRRSGWWAAAAAVVAAAGVTLFARAAVQSSTYESATLIPAVSDGAPTPVVLAADTDDSLSAERLVARKFTISSRDARQVALVGDFNQWNPRRHRLHRDGQTETWYITVQLPAGLHKYAFIVNDSVWTTDPSALRTVDRDFGVTSSLVLVQ